MSDNEKKLKTLKNLKEKDNERSGCLTPENGVDYDYSKGEPKYHTAYKVDYSELRSVAREWIKELEDELSKLVDDVIKEPKIRNTAKSFVNVVDYSKQFFEKKYLINWIKYFFNLEE